MGLVGTGLQSFHLDIFKIDHHPSCHTRHMCRRLCLPGLWPRIEDPERECNITQICDIGNRARIRLSRQGRDVPFKLCLLGSCWILVWQSLEGYPACSAVGTDFPRHCEPIHRSDFSS